MTSNTRMPVLVNLDTNESFTLANQSTTIGRSPENEIILDDEYVSGQHARIYWEAGWWVEDLGSSNGTNVNDQLLNSPWKLTPQDVIRVGRTQFRIQ